MSILQQASKSLGDRIVLLRFRARRNNEDQVLAKCPFCHGLIETDHKYLNLSKRIDWLFIIMILNLITLPLFLGILPRMSQGVFFAFWGIYLYATIVFPYNWCFKKWIVLSKVSSKNVLNKKTKALNKKSFFLIKLIIFTFAISYGLIWAIKDPNARGPFGLYDKWLDYQWESIKKKSTAPEVRGYLVKPTRIYRVVKKNDKLICPDDLELVEDLSLGEKVSSCTIDGTKMGPAVLYLIKGNQKYIRATYNNLHGKKHGEYILWSYGKIVKTNYYNSGKFIEGLTRNNEEINNHKKRDRRRNNNIEDLKKLCRDGIKRFCLILKRKHNISMWPDPKAKKKQKVTFKENNIHIAQFTNETRLERLQKLRELCKKLYSKKRFRVNKWSSKTKSGIKYKIANFTCLE